MKKSILLLAFVFLASSLLPYSQASREAYHSYLLNKQKENGAYRNFTEGRQSVTNKVSTKGKSVIRRKNKNIRRSFALRKTRPLVGRRAEEQNRKLRPSTQKKFNKVSPRVTKPVVHAGKIRLPKILLKTYENTDFSFQIPQGMEVLDAQNHTFKHKQKDFKLKITKIENKACPENSGFQSCAINLSKAETAKLSTNQKFILTSRVHRVARKFDTVLNEPKKISSVLMESFSAKIDGEPVVMNRYFVPDSEGSVYLLETQSGIKTIKANIAWSKAIFNSFRVYPQE